MIDVSVVIPVFNAQEFLEECLKSVLSQTAKVEILCVDDGSTDGSSDILNLYARNNSNVHIFHQENLGSGPARNLALEHAKGRFVAFMDADDLYPDCDTLKYLVDLADANGCEVAGGYLQLFSSEHDAELDARYTRGWISRNKYPRLGVIDFSEYQSPLGYQRYIFNRDMLCRNNLRFKPLRRFQDPPFCAAALHAAGKGVVSDRAVYSYRRGNHVVDWASDNGLKAQHFLEGRLWILKFAREHNYAKLFEMMYEDIYRALPKEVQRLAPVAARYQEIERYVATLNRKTVAFVFNDFSQGGIQRVMTLLVPQFVHNWYRVVLLTTNGTQNDVYAVDVPVRRVVLGEDVPAETRGARLRQAIRDHGIDIVIFQEYYSPKLAGDFAAVKSLGVPVVIHHHNMFSNFFQRLAGGIDEVRQYQLFKDADAMIVLSKSDEYYFRTLGVNAHYFPNPIMDVPSGFVRNREGKRILWMARFTEIKRPMDAVRIFAKVLDVHPDAQLYMLGDLDGAIADAVKEYVESNEKLRHSVNLEGFQSDVWSYLASASVFLTTAKFEGFLYTLAEASAAAVPTVGYELPYLELSANNDGFLQSPQLDVESAAEKICHLLSDENAYRHAAMAARAAFERVRSFNQIEAYGRLFASVFDNQRVAKKEESLPEMVLRIAIHDACIGISELKKRNALLRYEKNKIVAQRNKLQEQLDKSSNSRDVPKLVQTRNQQEKIGSSANIRAAMDGLDETPSSLQCSKLRVALNKKKREVDELKNSTSYRIGLVITWPARKVWRAFRDNPKVDAWYKRRGI